ncbi:hypothetical protein [uncultured Campylobacter sp.]|nr:hypothetical protein [uncultured Campylobacter sp.]
MQKPNGSVNRSTITNCLAVSNFTKTTRTDQIELARGVDQSERSKRSN